MTNEKQIELFEEFINKQKEIFLKKRDDYANEDVMSNFKQVGFITGLKPEQSILTLIATKVARLGNLLSGKEPKNESIDDTLVDMANYCFLLYCLRNEDRNYIYLRGKVNIEHKEKNTNDNKEDELLTEKQHFINNLEKTFKEKFKNSRIDEIEKFIEKIKNIEYVFFPDFWYYGDISFITNVLNKILEEKRANQNASL